MPNSLKSHIETLREMFALAANERRMKEADAINAAIESLSRQGGDMSKNPENLDTSAERVYGIDTSQVEYDRDLIAKMLDESADVADCEIGFYSAGTLREQAALLRAAANRDAAGVHTGRASEAGDWVLVPRVPTKEMCRAGLAERHDDLAKSIYAAMIAAAGVPHDK